jgi:methyl halide transferase
MSQLDRWENRYVIGDIPWDTGNPSTELQRVIAEEKLQPCTAIDLGCGTGVNAVWLAEMGFDVTAIDISPTAVDRGRQRKAKAGVRVRFVTSDVLDPPDDIGGPYHFFFDRGCYHIVREIDVGRYLRTLERITESGSIGLVLTGNSNEPRTGPPVVSEQEIRAELGSLFEIVRLGEFRFDLSLGVPGKPLGWSCLLRRRTTTKNTKDTKKDA